MSDGLPGPLLPPAAPLAPAPAPAPPEVVGPYVKRDLLDGEGAYLERGQFRVTFHVPAGTLPIGRVLRQQEANVAIEGEEIKRVFIHKLDCLQDGETNRCVAVITVIDNPIWIGLAIRGIMWAAGAAAAWVTLDKVEATTETVGGSVFITALSVAGVLVALKYVGILR